MMGVSLRAYARLRGVRLSAVQKAIATKRITPNADGTLDPERANQEWERNTFAGKTLHEATRPQVVPLAPPRPPRGGLGMPGQPEVTSDPVSAYLRARAVSETYKAKLAQLDFEERAGKVMPTTKAGEYATQFSGVVGDVLSSWPDQLTPMLAAATEESVVHRIISREVAALRRKIAKGITDAGF